MLSPPMRTSRPLSARSRARKMLATASAALALLILGGFHAILLWQRLLDLSLFRPVPAIRWLATAAMLVGLYRLHRRGVSLIRGRHALVFWLLVLLLHASFWGPLADPSTGYEGWTGTGLLLGLPAFTVVLGLLTRAIRRLIARAAQSDGIRDLPGVASATDRQTYTSRTGFLPTLACRPPPVRAL